jgi:hypothetical protein
MEGFDNVTNDELIEQIRLLQEQAAAAAIGPTDVALVQPLLDSIQDQKSSALNAAYGDLQDSTNSLHALYYYGAREEDLSGAQAIALEALRAPAQALVQDEQLAKRQNEINQWTANNKLDTLFIYQQLLIILCTTIILVYLMKRGIISTTVLYLIVGVLVLIFVFTIINRSQYTKNLRDKQYWNKRTFEKQVPVEPPTICS